MPDFDIKKWQLFSFGSQPGNGSAESAARWFFPAGDALPTSSRERDLTPNTMVGRRRTAWLGVGATDFLSTTEAVYIYALLSLWNAFLVRSGYFWPVYHFNVSTLASCGVVDHQSGHPNRQVRCLSECA